MKMKTMNTMMLGAALVTTLALFQPTLSYADARNPNTDWFKESRCGVFMHLLASNAESLAMVDVFDANALAGQLESVGAKYFVLTLGQNSGFMNSPNPTYNRYTGYEPGQRCSKRDLPMDIYKALRPKGIRLMLYLPCQVPNGDARAQKAFGLPQGAKDQPIDVAFAQKWAEVIYDWSSRYKDKVAGWWFDGGYQHIHFNEQIAQIYADAVKRGNPKAIVTFNPGVKLIRWTKAEDYTAGELNEPFGTVPTDRWVNGSQWHALTYLGSHWSRRDMRYPAEKWANWVRAAVAAEGVVTIDAGPNWNPKNGPIGAISDEQIGQLRAIRDALPPPEKKSGLQKPRSADKKVKVFVLAGQSNMEGHGMLNSLDHLGNHPKYGHLIKKLKNADGSWAVRDDVTISYQAEHRNKKNGPLTVGWGCEEHEIGPELIFGTIMGERCEEHVLLIKTAWGGKSVWCDFRSGSAGEMTWDEKRILKRDNHLKPGLFYDKMLAEIKECLANINDIVPGYEGQGYEIVGMAWFQGWNDFCEWHLQLDGKRVGLGLIGRYPHNLAAMFRDLRKDLDAPDMPIVIGELGVGGHEMTKRAQNQDDHEAVAMVKFRKAQKAVADDPSLKNITFVPTADFWDTRLQELRVMSDAYWNEKQKKGIKDTENNHLPTKELNDEYWRLGGHWYCHYNGSAANYSLIGYALAEALNTDSGVAEATGDIVIADFEGKDYGGWKVTGSAFGSGPVKGTQAARHTVSGFKGNGLVDTYVDPDGNFNDDNTGTLTSPEFIIERDYITFLIGGGAHDNTCLQLLVAEKVAASSSGEDDEKLVQRYFGVAKYKGKAAILRIVDDQKGGWAHVNVDQIVQSNQKPKTPNYLSGQTKEMTLAKQYILFPIQNGSKKVRIDVSIDGRNVREFDAEIAISRDKVNFWAFLDVTAFKGKVAILKINGVTQEGMGMIVQSNEIPGAGDFYSELLRPQFHFSQKIGWNNDGNGMVYYDGEWHLYFQHNPYGWNWGNMHWGHAVSKDLVRWEQLPIAIYNKKRGDWAFSGGGVLDENNSAGWQTGKEKVIVASWTSTGRGECIAYSNDRGRTFTEYEGNPVIKHEGRDPKIVWYGPGRHWVLAVYDHYEDAPYMAFYNSTDLKNWQFQSRLKGYYECPELFELPVDGDTRNTRWVVFAADARYAIGRFDGKTFSPEHEGKHRLHYGNYYASQLFSNTPDGRKIQVGWAQIAMPGMPFNQTFSFPHELTLRTTERGIRMFAEPVKEIEKIYKKKQTAKKKKLTEGKPVSLDVSGDIFDVTATFEPGDAKVLGLDIGGNRIEYSVETGRLQDAPLKPVDGKVTIRVLIDRPMMEIIGNHGRVFITRPREKKGEVKTVEAFAVGGTARLVKVEVNELESIWKK